MRTYWDLSKSERAALDREGLKRYEQIELMTQGIEAPQPPALEPVPDPGKIERVARFRVVEGTGYRRASLGSVAFRTAEDAAAFLALKPERIDHDYGADADHIAAILDPTIEQISVLDEEAFVAVRTALSEAKAVQQRNEEAQSEFRKLSDLADKALREIHEDWHAARARVCRLDEIREAYRNYLDLADGDEAVALRFLARTYGMDAYEALGIDPPPETAESSAGASEDPKPAAGDDEVAF